MVAPSKLYLPVVVITVDGVTRLSCSARPTVIGFIIEPGSKVSVSTRLRSCSPDSRVRSLGL
ncbi:hypothetical protein D3C85_1917000 [compost metagenome]